MKITSMQASHSLCRFMPNGARHQARVVQYRVDLALAFVSALEEGLDVLAVGPLHIDGRSVPGARFPGSCVEPVAAACAECNPGAGFDRVPGGLVAMVRAGARDDDDLACQAFRLAYSAISFNG